MSGYSSLQSLISSLLITRFLFIRDAMIILNAKLILRLGKLLSEQCRWAPSPSSIPGAHIMEGEKPIFLVFHTELFLCQEERLAYNFAILLICESGILFMASCSWQLLTHVRAPSSVVFSGVSIWKTDFFLKCWRKSPGKSPFSGAWGCGKFSLYCQYNFSVDETVLVFLFLIDSIVYSRICFSFILKRT